MNNEHNDSPGKYLRELRHKNKLSIYKVARSVNISGNYLSQIERGQRTPSEIVIHSLARFYDIDETELLSMYKKTMPAWAKDLLDIPHFKRMIIELAEDKKLDTERLERISKELYEIYNSHLKGKDNKK